MPTGIAKAAKRSETEETSGQMGGGEKRSANKHKNRIIIMPLNASASSHSSTHILSKYCSNASTQITFFCVDSFEKNGHIEDYFEP